MKKSKDEQEFVVLPFHETFPVHLKFLKEKRDCFFKDQIDMKKFVTRHKLKKKDYEINKTLPRD